MSKPLTGNLNLDIEILRRLDDAELKNYCDIKNTHIRRICTGNDLWRLRVLDRYRHFAPDPTKPDDEVLQDIDMKYGHVTNPENPRSHWMQLYIKLLNIINYEDVPDWVTLYKNKLIQYHILQLYQNVEMGLNTRKEFEKVLGQIPVGSLIVDEYGTSLIGFISETEEILGSYEPLNNGQIAIVFSYPEKMVKFVGTYEARQNPDYRIIWAK